jgi:hypothetical protein
VTAKSGCVVFDCLDALVVGRFWFAAIGRPLDPGASSEFAKVRCGPLVLAGVGVVGQVHRQARDPVAGGANLRLPFDPAALDGEANRRDKTQALSLGVRTKGAQAGADLLDQDLGLFQGGEVPAFVGLTVVDQIAVGVFDPASWQARDVPREHGHRNRKRQLRAGALATCEAALDNLRLAFAAAGKALHVIRDARLYRNTHDTFEAYVEQRWGMGKSQAYRLVEAWPLAERLSPIGERLTESHVRELLPFAGRHGHDAAATVYQAVAEADGIRVTASVLHDVVGILPADYFDPAEAVSQIRAYLTGGHAPAQPPPADSVQAFTSESGKFVRNLHRFATSEAIRAAQAANPDAVRQAVADIRAALDEVERVSAVTR